MKWRSPLLAAAALILAAGGLWRLTGATAAAQSVQAAGAWIVERQLGQAAEVVHLAQKEAAPQPSPATSSAPSSSPSPLPVPVETVAEAWDEENRRDQEEIPAAELPLAADVSLELRNGTEYAIDFTQLPDLPAGLDFDSGDPVILIVHTHTTESYTDPEQPEVYRSQAEDNGVMAVGDAMALVLRQRGYGVIHDKTLCDYPEYNGAYSRSRTVIQENLEETPSLCLVLDVHRDAVEDENGDQLRLTAEAGGETAAQLMLVVGTDEGGLEHPRWRENLSLAAVLQAHMGAAWPGVMRPINLRSERFNQDEGAMSLLVEVGTSGNTLEEALRGARCFAGVLSDVLDQYSGKSS